MRLHVGACTLVLLGSCGFVTSAGDIEIGAGTVPRVTYDLRWPKPDDLLGDAMNQGPSGGSLGGAPTSLEAATLAHVQGLMTIDGECHRTFAQAAVTASATPGAAAASTTIKNLHVEVVNCGDPSRCRSRCGDLRGMRLEARVQIQLLDADKAAKVKTSIKNPSAEAVTSIRARFFGLNFYELRGTKKYDVGKLFSGYQLGLSSAGGGDDTVLVTGRDLWRIKPDAPQRFELDPAAPFTLQLKQSVVAGKPLWIEVFQHIDVAQADLYSVRLAGAGVDLDFQPEFVINGIAVAAGYLQ